MRFYEDGPSIPDELLRLRDEGRVVFFCGAGVSMGAELPSFTGLARSVLENLRSPEQSEEQKLLNAMDELENKGLSGVISADRVFSVLEKSFDHSQIAAEVAKALKPKPQTDLAAHRSILKLSTHNDGCVRLVTTNFDMLFEDCAAPNCHSHTRSNLPRVALGKAHWGIVHLHGRVNTDYTGPDGDGFVLSSGEFGEAYLANGWARDFVREILEGYAAVFIGYTADDPPVRYLLEGLQLADNTPNRLFAFHNGPQDEATARWHDKGVSAIAYDVDDGDIRHSRLYSTLDAWSDRAKDPARWRRIVLNKAKTGPQKQMPHERGMLCHIIKTKEGAGAFRKHKPSVPTNWIGVFDPRLRYAEAGPSGGPLTETEVIEPFSLFGLDSDPAPPEKNEKFSRQKDIPKGAWDAFSPQKSDRIELDDKNVATLRDRYSRAQPQLPTRLSHLSDWIADNAHHPATIWWAAQQSALHPELIDSVRRKLERPDTRARKVVVEAWRRLIEYFTRVPSDDFPLIRVEQAIQKHGWSSKLIREYVEESRVKLKKETYFRRLSPPKGNEKILLRDLIHVSVDFPERGDQLEIPNAVLDRVIPALRRNVEEAIDLEQEYSGWLDVSPFIPPEEADEDDYSRVYGLSGYVLRFSTLFERFADNNPDKARREFQSWRNTDQVFQRMRLWAARRSDLASISEFYNEVLAMNRKTFWSDQAERDLLISLSMRWNEFSGKQRNEIEKILLAGPPKWRGEDDG